MAKWIKVTDKLPKIGTPVLVIVHTVSQPKRSVGMDEVVSITTSLTETTATWKGTDTDLITHWQPLPALPEVDGGVK